MEARIQSVLNRIEAERNVRILYAAESGSRAWGFASEDSDYDVRFVYLQSIKDYLGIDLPRDVLDLPITDSLDVNGWDMYKALGLFRKSNPPLFEWLFSPIVYRELGDFANSLRTLAREHYSARRMTYHYLNMTRNAYDVIEGRTEVAAKKYLYALRPLICIRWIEQRQSPPPTSIHTALEGVELAHEVRADLSDLIERKQTLGELGTIPPDAVLTPFIASEIERIAGLVAGTPDDVIEKAPLNELAWKELGLDRFPASAQV